MRAYHFSLLVGIVAQAALGYAFFTHNIQLGLIAAVSYLLTRGIIGVLVVVLGIVFYDSIQTVLAGDLSEIVGLLYQYKSIVSFY